MRSQVSEFQLEDLPSLIHVPAGKAAMYVEACVWCMDKHGHASGIQLEFTWDQKNCAHPICWTTRASDLDRIRSHYNIDDALPFGAEVLAIFLCVTHTEYKNIQRSARMTGIDYWLSRDAPDPSRPFQNSGRLEISGMLSESEHNTVEQRLKEKLKQTQQSANTKLPVYVVVVAFDHPRAKMVARNANGH